MHMHTELRILEYANSATTKHKLQAEGRKNKASTEMYRKVEEDWEAGRTHEGKARVLGGEDDLLLSWNQRGGHKEGHFQNNWK